MNLFLKHSRCGVTLNALQPYASPKKDAGEQERRDKTNLYQTYMRPEPPSIQHILPAALKTINTASATTF